MDEAALGRALPEAPQSRQEAEPAEVPVRKEEEAEGGGERVENAVGSCLRP